VGKEIEENNKEVREREIKGERGRLT